MKGIALNQYRYIDYLQNRGDHAAHVEWIASEVGGRAEAIEHVQDFLKFMHTDVGAAVMQQLRISTRAADLTWEQYAATIPYRTDLLVSLAGRRVFTLSPELFEIFKDTDITDVPTDLLRLPFEGLVIELPTGIGINAQDDEGTSDRLVTDVCVALIEESYSVKGANSASNKTINKFLCVNLCAPAPGPKFVTASTLVPIVEGSIKEAYSALDEGSIEGQVMAKVLPIVVNTLLYINSKQADLIEVEGDAAGIKKRLASATNEKKAAQLRRRLERLSRRVLVGSRIIIDRTNEPTGYASANAERRRELQHKFRVRGHWRSQAHGPSHSMRRPLFIAPYWKGPELADVINKNFTVK